MGKALSFALTLSMAMALASCNNFRVKAPKDLLSEDRMVEIITDVEIIEGKLLFNNERNGSAEALKDSYYRQLFEHHNITKEQFINSINYYTQKPDMLENIMARVVDSITKEQIALPKQ